MWFTVLVTLSTLNAMMIAVHYGGPKAIVLTWIPGRTALLLGSLLHKPELEHTLKYAWASGLVPVAFLVMIHSGLKRLQRRGRLPRFTCATWPWLQLFGTAIVTMGCIILIIGLVRSDALEFLLGCLAVGLNVINLKDAPTHLQSENVHLTVGYIVSVNVVVLAILLGMNYLIDYGELVWAGIVANIPMLAIMLLIGSSCKDSPKALRITSQHVYMLSYQTWPNMAFVGILRASMSLGEEMACGIAAVSSVVIIIIQYMAVKTIL